MSTTGRLYIRHGDKLALAIDRWGNLFAEGGLHSSNRGHSGLVFRSSYKPMASASINDTIDSEDAAALVSDKHISHAQFDDAVGDPILQIGVRADVRVAFTYDSQAGVVEPGSVSHQPVVSVDYFPTVLEAAGVSPTESRDIDGASLVTHLRSGGKSALAREELFWHFPHYRGRVTPYSIIRRDHWKLIKRHEGPTFELFDLAHDLGEKSDLAATEPERIAALDQALTAHLAQVGARLPRPNPAYRSAASGK